jgi:hypothetical protein
MITRFASSMAAVAMAVIAPSASAVVINFTLLPPGNNNPDIASQLTMDVTESSGKALFKLSNSGSISSTITAVYFYDGSLLALSTIQDKDDMINGQLGLATVDFSTDLPLSPDSLPQYPAALFGADRDAAGGVSNGIDTGEWLSFLFDLKPGKTFADLLADLDAGTVYMGLHVQRIGGEQGGSDWFVSGPPTEIVPEGGATLVLCGTALFAMGLLRRRLNA